MVFNSVLILFLIIAILILIILLFINIKAAGWQTQYESNLAQAEKLHQDFLKKYASGDAFLKKYTPDEPYQGLYRGLEKKLNELGSALENLDARHKEFQNSVVKNVSIYNFLSGLIIDPLYWQQQQRQSGKWIASTRQFLEQEWELIKGIQKKIEQVKNDIYLQCQKMSFDIKRIEDLHKELQKDGFIATSNIEAAIQNRKILSQKFDRISQTFLKSIDIEKISNAEIIMAYKILQELKFNCKNLLEQAEIWIAITARISSEISKLHILILYVEQKAINLKVMACEKQIVDERKKLERIVDLMRGMPDHVEIDRLEAISRLVVSIK